ncbi:MAG TPA: hypothetical protein VH251_10845 [Verrucomicrobiae bacterium]|jgi:hypothetical protein|nr:hypothetical protein [Verrucomicrobiae bacterium]
MESFSTQEPPYDFNGLLALVLAGIENLREHAIDQDLIDYAQAISNEQALFLQKMLNFRAKSKAQFEGTE